MQLGGIIVMALPTFFVARALQPTMAGAISAEADQYFAFVLVGTVALMLTGVATTTLQGTIAGGISTGYFEALLMTRAPLTSILAGLTSYGLLLAAVRSGVLIVAGAVLGAQIFWGNVLTALLILALLVAIHWGVGLVAAALVIAFRTSGPVLQAVAMASLLFGGVYYPVSVIPSWLGIIAKVTPLAYGLPPLRRVLLQGEGFTSVGTDVAILTVMGVVALTLGALSIQAALRYARRAGTLGAY
jgi:ABC-2 type transport system permease protein